MQVNAATKTSAPRYLSLWHVLQRAQRGIPESNGSYPLFGMAALQ